MFKKMISGLFIAAVCTSSLSADQLKVKPGQFGGVESGPFAVVSVLKENDKISKKNLFSLMYGGAHQVVLFHDGEKLSETNKRTIQVFNRAAEKNFVVGYHAKGVSEASEEDLMKRCKWGILGSAKSHYMNGTVAHAEMLDLSKATFVPFRQDEKELTQGLVAKAFNGDSTIDVLVVEGDKITLDGEEFQDEELNENINKYSEMVEQEFNKFSSKLIQHAKVYDAAVVQAKAESLANLETKVKTDGDKLSAIESAIAKTSEALVKAKKFHERKAFRNQLESLKEERRLLKEGKAHTAELLEEAKKSKVKHIENVSALASPFPSETNEARELRLEKEAEAEAEAVAAAKAEAEAIELENQKKAVILEQKRLEEAQEVDQATEEMVDDQEVEDEIL